MASIAFTARGSGVNTLGYEGALSGDGSISWSERLNYESNNADICSPTRIAANGESNALLSLDADPTGFKRFMFRLGGSYDLGNLGSNTPRWENFDLHSSGLGVALREDPLTLQISTDWGVTWTDVDIDYLVDLLGAGYSSISLDDQAFAIELDELTGSFYLLIPYSLDGKNYWTLLKSDNGTTWSKVNDWSGVGYNYGWCSLAVSNDYLYIAFYNAGRSIVYVEHSSDGGSNWAETEVDASTYYLFQITAHESVALLYLANGDGDSAIVLRSEDSGAVWSQVLQIDYPDLDVMDYCVLRSSGDIFALTFCRADSPNATASWTDGDGTHSLAGEGTAYLCFWLSQDDGETWSLILSPVKSDARLQQSLDVFVPASGESASLSPSESPSISPSVSPSVSPSQPIMPINPYVMLTWSDDGGMTWSNEYWRPVGRIGEHRKRLIWRQLGRAKDRVFKIAVSDPCKWIFIDSIIDADEGTSRR